MTPDRSIRIEGLRRAVADLARAVDFYRGALGFELARSDGHTARLQLGAQHIDLVLLADSALMQPAASAPDPRFQHAAIVTDDMQAAWRRLEAHATVAISRDGPQVLPANTGGVTAFKFRDPDGHPLELIRFPAGVGDPCWQVGRADGPTLGIDHFALVVGAVDRSTSFFAARLDFRVAARAVNRGAEQDRLDGLDGVEVDVIALEPRTGPRTPHLELLCYRHPRFAASAAPALHDQGRDEVVCRGVARLRLHDPDGHRFSVEA